MQVQVMRQGGKNMTIRGFQKGFRSLVLRGLSIYCNAQTVSPEQVTAPTPSRSFPSGKGWCISWCRYIFEVETVPGRQWQHGPYFQTSIQQGCEEWGESVKTTCF